MDLLTFVFAIEVGGAALPATISLSSRMFTFWGPFFIIHIGILLIGLDHIVDNHSFGALEKLVGFILLLLFSWFASIFGNGSPTRQHSELLTEFG